MKLSGRCAVVTGASQGFGCEVAKMFLEEGASVMICARGAEKLRAAERELSGFVRPGARLLSMPADISDKEQINSVVHTALQEFGRLDILVANAGVHGTKGPIDEVDWEEWSRAIDINLKGTVLQCISVLPHFKKNKSGKIIILSGGGATKPMPNLSAYAASKAAVVRFAETLAEECAEYHIDVNAVAPGAMNTRLLDDALQAGPEKLGKKYYDSLIKQKNEGGTPMNVGASLCVFLASKESDGITGRLISAVWDPWQQLTKFKENLKNTDIYTLRRIIPEDRGQDWGK
jgi:NAD(P)-dependent dehydrogenase (short-subunit alcohol dehydrogenase family)